MKSFYLSLIILLAFNTGRSQTVFDESIKDLDGKPVNLRAWQHKKYLFVELPVVNADSIMKQVDSFMQNHTDDVVVIGLLTKENGFLPSLKQVVKAMYAGKGIILTEGMSSKPGSDQSLFYQWLSSKERNGRMNIVSRGIGHKYFASESGKLIVAFPPAVRLTNPVITRLMQAGKKSDK